MSTPMMFDQLQPDPVDAQPRQQAVGVATPQTEAPPDFDSLQDDGEKYGSLGQQGIAGLEGIARGVAGPIAPLAERALGVSPESIRGRQEANPVTAGVGEAAGLAGSMLTGVGEGELMVRAGAKAAEVAGLAMPATYIAKVGSAAVKSAAEMAVLQGGDEVSKMVLQDPNTSAESAIANIGMAAALGGVTGGFITGAISPLWNSTAGPVLDKTLGGIKDYLNGASVATLSPEAEKAVQTLGIELSPELKAGLSGDPKAAQMFNELREAQHPSIVEGMKNLDQHIGESVVNSIGKSPEDIMNYSEAEGGRHAMDSFKNEYKAKYEPIVKEYDDLQEPFKEAAVGSTATSDLAEKVTQMAQSKGYLGADIPQQKVIDAVLARLPSVKSVADLAKLNTIVDNIAGRDLVLQRAGRDLKSLILDAQQNALGSAIQKDAPQLFQKYQAARASYAQLAKMSEAVGSELSIGRFNGPKSFIQQIESKRSPEQFLRSLSPKGNAEVLDLMSKHFPETLEVIRDNELKQIVRPAFLSAKGEQPVNLKTLANAIDKGMAGQKERINFAIPQEAIDKIQAARTLQESLPSYKSSGTAGWQQKMLATWPQSAMASIAMITGHNPFMGAIVGHIGKLLSREAPDAVKLGLLKFMAAEEPIKAEGFKSMVEFLHNVSKNESILNKASAAVFTPGLGVLAGHLYPTQKDQDKLEKIVDKYQENPEKAVELLQGQTGHYLPNHQTALTETVMRNLQYLAGLKPQPTQLSPLDKPIDPSHQALARYYRAIEIANQPAIVLDRVKDGTIQLSDIQDLNAMYPGLKNRMVSKLSDTLMTRHSEDGQIPYKTRMGLSALMGHSIDSTLNPQSIMAAQPVPKPLPQPPNTPMKGKTGKSAINKISNSYKTQSQSAESDRENRK